MNTICKRILVFTAALALLCPVIRSEQSQKASKVTQEDRIKKLEERADAAERAAASAAMERDYLARIQKQYESYYQKAFNTQMWTLGIVGLLLTAIFGLVARFSLRMIDERTKLVTAEATVQMRNEYARAIAKEVQKLWDSNAADIKKLKEAITTQAAELEQNLKDRSEFQMHFVQALASAVDERDGDPAATFRNALTAYKSGKPRNLVEPKVGAITVRYIFEALRKAHGDNHVQKANEELANPLYNGLDEELALAALQSPWLTPLINERRPVPPEPPAPAPPEPAAEPRHAAPARELSLAESELPLDEESDSCRLITT